MGNEKIKEQLARYYDTHAVERDGRTKQDWKRVFRENFLRLLKENGCGKLLEIGAGTGQDALYFIEQGLIVTAIDLSGEHVRFCRDKGIDARQMDFYYMEFDAGAFDALYALNCLLHVPPAELPAVHTEIQRVVKRDGFIFIGNYGNMSGKRYMGTDISPSGVLIGTEVNWRLPLRSWMPGYTMSKTMMNFTGLF